MEPQSFQPTFHNMKNGCTWEIKSGADLNLALDVLRTPNYAPSSVSITHTPDMVQSKFNDFLYVIIKKKCELSVSTAQFRDAGQAASTDTKEFIALLLDEFKNKTAKCILKEYRGPLTLEDLTLLPKTVKILGIPLHTRQEADIVVHILTNVSSFTNLQELYVSVAPTITKKDVELFQGFCNIRFGLVFSNLQDSQVKWMMDIVTTLDKPFQSEHVCMDEIYLPSSTLTIKGLSQLLRLFKRPDGALKYPVLVECQEIHEAARNDLQTNFKEHGSSIVFNTRPADFKRDLFGRKEMSKTHGFGIIRYIGSFVSSIIYSVWSRFLQSPEEIKYLVDSGV